MALVATLEAQHTQGLLSPYFKTRAEGKTTHHARCKHENTLFDNRLLSLHPRTHAIKRLPQALAHLSKRLQQNSHNLSRQLRHQRCNETSTQCVFLDWGEEPNRKRRIHIYSHSQWYTLLQQLPVPVHGLIEAVLLKRREEEPVQRVHAHIQAPLRFTIPTEGNQQRNGKRHHIEGEWPLLLAEEEEGAVPRTPHHAEYRHEEVGEAAKENEAMQVLALRFAADANVEDLRMI